MKNRIVVLAAIVLLAVVIVAVTRLFWWENAGIVLALAGLVTAAGYLYHTFGDVDGIRTEQSKLDLVALLAGAAIVITSLLIAVFELTGSDVSKWLLLPFSIAMGALSVTVFFRETTDSSPDGQPEHSQSGQPRMNGNDRPMSVAIHRAEGRQWRSNQPWKSHQNINTIQLIFWRSRR